MKEIKLDIHTVIQYNCYIKMYRYFLYKSTSHHERKEFYDLITGITKILKLNYGIK